MISRDRCDTTDARTGLGVARGGAFNLGVSAARASARTSPRAEGAGAAAEDWLGFRCCRPVTGGGATGCALREMPGACRPGVDPRCDVIDVAINGNIDGPVCAVFTDGSVRCWSRGPGRAYLGTGTTGPCLAPGLVPSLTNVEQIEMGNDFTCVVRNGPPRSVWCWGANELAQFGGPGSGTRDLSLSPIAAPDIPAPALPGVLSFGGSSGFSYGTTGAITAWGRDDQGQLGDGTVSPRTTGEAAHAVTLPNYRQVALANEQGRTACGVFTNSGEVRCWGAGDGHQFGAAITPVTSTTASATAVTVPGITGAREVRVGLNFVCAVRTDDTLWCWGTGRGRMEAGNGPTPTRVLDRTTQVVMSSDVVCALRADGTVWCWGQAPYVGNGHPGVGYITAPEQVRGLTGVVRLYAGSGTVCAHRGGADLRCWGWASGVGSGGYSGVPVPIVW